MELGRHAQQRRAQLVDPGARDRTDRDGFDVRERTVREVIAGFLDGEVGVPEIAARHGQHAMADAERVQRGQVLGGLSAPAFIRRDDEEHGGNRADAGEHVRDKPLMPWYVDECDLRPIAEPRPCVAEVDRHPAATFLRPSIGLHSGQRADQCGLAVVDVSGRRDYVHRSSISRPVCTEEMARRRVSSSAGGMHLRSRTQCPCSTRVTIAGRPVRNSTAKSSGS